MPACTLYSYACECMYASLPATLLVLDQLAQGYVTERYLGFYGACASTYSSDLLFSVCTPHSIHTVQVSAFVCSQTGGNACFEPARTFRKIRRDFWILWRVGLQGLQGAVDICPNSVLLIRTGSCIDPIPVDKIRCAGSVQYRSKPEDTCNIMQLVRLPPGNMI